MGAKIIAVTTKSGKNYTVGHVPAHLEGMTVENITFHRPEKVYNGGFQTSLAGYSVAMVDDFVRRLIPEHEIAEVWVDTSDLQSKKKKSDDESPANFITAEEGD